MQTQPLPQALLETVKHTIVLLQIAKVSLEERRDGGRSRYLMLSLFLLCLSFSVEHRTACEWRLLPASRGREAVASEERRWVYYLVALRPSLGLSAPWGLASSYDREPLGRPCFVSKHGKEFEESLGAQKLPPPIVRHIRTALSAVDGWKAIECCRSVLGKILTVDCSERKFGSRSVAKCWRCVVWWWQNCAVTGELCIFNANKVYCWNFERS